MSRRRSTVANSVAGAFLVGALLLGSLFSGNATPAQALGPTPQQQQLIERLKASTNGQLVSTTALTTGTYNFVRATGDAVLLADGGAAAPDARAFGFLATYGPLLGLRNPAAELSVTAVERDQLGMQHVRLNQVFAGVPVYGAQIIVHMNDRGITAVNGTIAPNVAVATKPAISAAVAQQQALASVAKDVPDLALNVVRSDLYVYRTGLLEGFFGENRLAFGVEIAGPGVRDAVWIDAFTGAELNRVSLIHKDLDRVVYSPSYDPSDPDANVQRREGDAPSLLPPVNNLYEFSGQTYNFFKNAFGRDSYDAAGATMRTVYLVNDACPNAYWDGATTNYCPGFDLDDVVAHEWGHAYTEKTHGLIYQYQSGALNESYSDIWGETIDLFNNADGIGGANNAQPYPNGQRWLVGEDLGQAVQELLLRDMWDPDRLASPGKVSSTNYHCSASDGGGVHTNSGVPNHAFAMLCDGKTYNGQTVGKIGVLKASHIYFRAMTAYQVPTTNFAAHADALEASCADLRGAPLNDFATGQVSSEVITDYDCAQVNKAMLAVEMRNPPTQCNFQPLLNPNAPAICSNPQVLFAEDWESGSDGWTMVSEGVNPEWPNYNWTVENNLPDDRAGSASFAVDAVEGSCAPGGDISGRFYMDSPTITLPASGSPTLRFDHWVATELAWDGGNLKISVNGGAFDLVPETAYSFNAPNETLNNQTPAPVGDGNTNPLGGEAAWTGTNTGEAGGSWGTTIVDLSQVAANGDRIQLRFDFGVDGCNGVTGWYVDDIKVYTCDGTGPNPSPSATPSATPSPTPSPTPVQQADLIVTDLVASQNKPKETELTATIKNVGKAATDKVSVRFLNGTSVIGERTFEGTLASGSSVNLTVPWNTKGLNGDYTVTAVADASKFVAESNEDNNSLQRTFTVRGNKVSNGSFEQSSSGSTPDSWSGSQDTAYETDGKGASDGSRAVSITGKGSPASVLNPAWTSTPIKVDAGQTYNLAMTVATVNASSAPSLQVSYLDAAGTVLSKVSGITSQVTGSSAAQLVTGQITIPAGVSQVRLTLSGFSPTDLATRGTFYFDDIWMW